MVLLLPCLVLLVAGKVADAVLLEQFVAILLGQLPLPRVRRVRTLPQELVIFPYHINVLLVFGTVVGQKGHVLAGLLFLCGVMKHVKINIKRIMVSLYVVLNLDILILLRSSDITSFFFHAIYICPSSCLCSKKEEIILNLQQQNIKSKNMILSPTAKE